MRNPYDGDDTVDPYSGDDVELRNPYEDGEPEKETPEPEDANQEEKPVRRFFNPPPPPARKTKKS